MDWDDLSNLIRDVYPSCPGCDTRLDDKGTDEHPYLECPLCHSVFTAGAQAR